MTGAFVVREMLSRPGRPGGVNDDAMAQSASLFCVIDGATGIGDGPLMPDHCGSDASWLAHGAARVLSHMDDAHVPFERVVFDTASALASEFLALRRRAPAGGYEMPYASMVLVRPRAGAIDYAGFGDCQMLVAHDDGRITSIGVPRKHRKNEVKLAAAFDALAGGREAALSELRRLRNLVNTEAGHGLLAPDPDCVRFLRTGTIALEGGADVLLMTDGFYSIVADYGALDDAGLMAAARAQGLVSLYRQIRAIEAGDALGKLFPRFKESDDATAIFARIN